MAVAPPVHGTSPRHHKRIISANTNQIGPKATTQFFSPIQPIPASTIRSIECKPSSKIKFPISSYNISITSAAAAAAAAAQQYAVQQQQQQMYSMPMQPNSSIRRYNYHSKRKSAVELLAESKPFYVKSETVLERQQQLNYRGTISPSRISLPHQRNSMHINRRSTSLTSSNLLQNKLRNLLDSSDSPAEMMVNQSPDKQNVCKYVSPVKFNQELTANPDGSNNEMPFLYPNAYLSPKSLPPQPVSDDDIYTYSIELTDDYDTISPPAEYAEANSIKLRTAPPMRYSSYQRSYSHSQAVASNDTDSSSFNINSHKSLPDLHSQICRHSPHSEVLSCCSRENRSNKSGSTFNRDSGGSSGHYTHRSEPCSKQQLHLTESISTAAIATVAATAATSATATMIDYRRDSGSSTQHSGNSYYGYGFSPVRYDCAECRTKIQDDANCLLNFTTLEVPEAFQDNYNTVISKDQQQQQQHYNEIDSYRRNVVTQSSPKKDVTELSPPLGTFKRQRCLRIKQRGRYFSPSDSNGRSDDDRRPILRSKSDICDKYWQRPMITIAPTSSNLYSSEQLSLDPASSSSCNVLVSGQSVSIDSKRATPKFDNSRGNTTTTTNNNNNTIGSGGLERFFEHLGLNDDVFDEFILTPIRSSSTAGDVVDESGHSSPVFFSDTSTIDSNRLGDSTDQTNQTNQNVKPSEPPSIVERNARIIKWLCNCRKFQNVM